MLRSVGFRVAAGALGLCLILLVLETALRIGSVVLKPEGQRVPTIVTGEEIRITCLGESTTLGGWPTDLEELLNDKGAAPRFRVVNRGMVGIRTNGVADRVEKWLDEDRPHIVVTMLGINDEGNVLVYPRSARRSWWVEHVMTFRLLDLLWRSSSDRGVPEAQAPAVIPSAEAHVDDETRSKLEQFGNRRPDATRRFRQTEMIEIQRDLLVVDPGSPVYHLGYLIGLVLYHDSAERIDEFFRNEIGVDPATVDDEERYRLIAGWVEKTGDRFAGIRLAASMAARDLDLVLERSRLEFPTDDPILEGLLELRLAELSLRARSPDAVRSHLMRADEVLPDDYPWSLLLGGIGFRVEAYDLAADHFNRARLVRPDLPASHESVLLGRLANAHELSGDHEQAARLRAELEEFELGRFREFTRYHYQQVIDAVRARGIPVIAVQYPLLPVSTLRKLLGHRDDVIYLENRENFEKALREDGYQSLFIDHFAGSFGHFSNQSNRMVAENVADAVWTLTDRPRPGSNLADSPRAPSLTGATLD